MPYFWQRCTLETWHMRSQPHPLNQEEGILPHVYDALIFPNTPPPCVHRTSSNMELTSGLLGYTFELAVGPSSISMHMLNNYRFVPVAMKKVLGIGLAGKLLNDFVAE